MVDAPKVDVPSTEDPRPLTGAAVTLEAVVVGGAVVVAGLLAVVAPNRPVVGVPAVALAVVVAPVVVVLAPDDGVPKLNVGADEAGCVTAVLAENSEDPEDGAVVLG